MQHTFSRLKKVSIPLGVAVLPVFLGLGGCQVQMQTQECVDFIACFDAYQAAFHDGDESAVARYRADGQCWSNAASALDCTQTCKVRKAFRNVFKANDQEVPGNCNDVIAPKTDGGTANGG